MTMFLEHSLDFLAAMKLSALVHCHKLVLAFNRRWVCRKLSLNSTVGALEIQLLPWTMLVNLSQIRRKHVSPLMPHASILCFLSLDTISAKSKSMLNPWCGALTLSECWPGATFFSLAWTQAVHSKMGHNGSPLKSGMPLQHSWAWAVTIGEKWHNRWCQSFLSVLVLNWWMGVCWKMSSQWGWFPSDEGNSSNLSQRSQICSSWWVWTALALLSLHSWSKAGSFASALLTSSWLVAMGWFLGETGGMMG